MGRLGRPRAVSTRVTSTSSSNTDGVHNYPAEAVARAGSACAEVYRLVSSRGEPFHEVAEHWLAELDGELQAE